MDQLPVMMAEISVARNLQEWLIFCFLWCLLYTLQTLYPIWTPELHILLILTMSSQFPYLFQQLLKRPSGYDCNFCFTGDGHQRVEDRTGCVCPPEGRRPPLRHVRQVRKLFFTHEKVHGVRHGRLKPERLRVRVQLRLFFSRNS